MKLSGYCFSYFYNSNNPTSSNVLKAGTIVNYYSQLLRKQTTEQASKRLYGNDMAQLGFKGKEIGETLGQLWDMALRRSAENEKETLLSIAKRIKRNTEKKKDKKNG